jgi:quercetin dioxygenase-like cupin family protein
MQTKPTSLDHRETLHLDAIEAELRRDDAYARDGHTARTLLRAPDLRIVLVAMRAGATMAEHHPDQTGSIQVLTGQVRLRFPDHVVEVAAGQLVLLEAGAAHDVEAVVESAFVLTLGWHARA